MAAGLGFKTFNTGDVLTASEVNGYLMQGILVFADATARDAAITSPQEGQFAFTKDNNSLWYYTGSVWAASGATGDIEGVTAGTGISGGGTSGTVTITNSMATAIDAKGDLIVGTGADTFDRLAVGTNGHTLVADSGETTGLKWAVDPVADLVTTAGDTLYATAADTLARLAIGTAGQVLQVNSGATAPEWATPASAATDYTLINAGGTALTGAATITVSSISNKNELAIEIVGASSNTINSTFTVRFNTDSGSNYDFVHHSFNTGPGTSFGSASQSQTSFLLTYMDNTADTFNAHLRLSGANAAGIKPYSGMSFGSQSGTTNRNVQGHYLGTSTISSISVISSAGNFDAGTIFVYGA